MEDQFSPASSICYAATNRINSALGDDDGGLPLEHQPGTLQQRIHGYDPVIQAEYSMTTGEQL